MPVILRWLLRMLPLNPIAVRLVQSAGRRGKHALVRAGYLAVLIGVLLWMLLLNSGLGGGGGLGYRELAQGGAASFVVIAYLQIALICILSPVFMASAIAQEANPKTWDILLTTPLGPGQIVVGNLVGRLFFVLGLLVSSLPLFAVTQFFGGVPGTAIFGTYAVAAGAAVLVGTIAVALSVSRLVGRRAVFAFYISVVSYIAATAALDRLIGGGARVTVFTGLNPFLAVSALLNPETYPRAEAGTHAGLAALFFERPVTAWVTVCGAISAALIVASSLTVRLGGLHTFTGGGGGGVPWYRRALGLGASGAEHRPPRPVGHNPIAWREATARNSTPLKIVLRWAFVLVGIALGVGLTAGYGLGWFGSMGAQEYRLILLSATWTEAAVIMLVAINMAATAVSREREDGTLDLLLTTPISPGQYLGGKLRGLIAYLLPMLAVPVVTIGAGGLFGLLGGGRAVIAATTNAPSHPIVLPEAGPLAAVGLLMFAAVCVMVGLQMSLKSKGTIGSVVGTVAWVGVGGGIVGLCGWQAGASIPGLGPALAALNPLTLLYASVNPLDAMAETISSGGMSAARVSLSVGALIGAGVYVGVIYGLHSGMVRGFDFTVRKLAGNK